MMMSRYVITFFFVCFFVVVVFLFFFFKKDFFESYASCKKPVMKSCQQDSSKTILARVLKHGVLIGDER